MYKRPTLFLVRLVAVALLLLTTVPFPHARAAGLGASASTIETLDSASTRQGEAQLAERSEQAGGWGLPKESHWHVEPGNLLVRDARFNYELDENHRRKVRIHRETGERTEYTWDCRDRLRQVKCPDGTRVRFFYDAFGRRVRKDVHPPLPNEEELRKLADEELRPALEAEEERRRGELASLEDIPSDQTADDVRAANSNQSMEPGALQVRPPAKAGADQALLPAPEEEVASPFRGLGQYYDAETQLSCTRYRYWEAETGRWLSADPIGLSGSFNLLGFDGSPTVWVDPLGLQCKEVGDDQPIYRSMKKDGSGQFVDSPPEGAPNGNQKGIRTPQSNKQFDDFSDTPGAITGPDSIVGPSTTGKQGLSGGLTQPESPDARAVVWLG